MQTLSQQALSIWAKSGEGADWHPLIAHMLDTAVTAWEVLIREPARTRELYARDLGLNAEAALPWVSALVGLHDLGKASPAFQRLWDPGADRLRRTGLIWSSVSPPRPVPHGVVSQIVVEELLVGKGLAAGTAQQASAAIGAHHGFRAQAVELDKVGPDELGGGGWDVVRRELCAALLDTVGAHGAPPSVCLTAAAFIRLAGLASFADWIASSPEYFPYGRDVANLQAYWLEALDLARAAVDAVGWRPRTPLPGERRPFDAVFSYLGRQSQFQARPLQRVVEEVLSEPASPMFLLIEAPMGEGKTEAAFYAHLRLQSGVGHRGMYVALPTQATGNSIFSRTVEFLRQMGRSTPPDIQLVHAASILNETYLRLRTGQVETDGVGAAEWFTHKKRALLSEYGVGTVDQALLGVLNVKHHFVRLWGLTNRTVIVDEVHAYDVYTTGLIETLVRWLGALGSSVVLMSATLPRGKRRALLEAFGAKNIPEARYPRVSWACGGRAEAREAPARPRAPVMIMPATADLPAVTGILAREVADGGCVAAVVNTVQRAQDLYLHLRACEPEVALYLFHARYPGHVRQAKEEELLRLFGRDGPRPSKAILVATQVVEQSLDLDFDVMLTDLAPLDLVLQRAGRLHRHDRARPRRHAQPTLYVAGLRHDGELPDLGSSNWDRVYESYVLLRSWAILRNTPYIRIPEDLDPLIEWVYECEDPPERLSDSARRAFREAAERMVRKQDVDVLDALHAVVGLPDGSWERPPALRQKEDDDPARFAAVLALTRKGEESVVAVPLHAGAGGLSLDPEAHVPVDPDKTPTADLARRLYLRSVRLSRWEVVRGLKNQPQTRRGWEQHPLLRDAYPLLLGPEGAVLGKSQVTLDEELGIIYRPA